MELAIVALMTCHSRLGGRMGRCTCLRTETGMHSCVQYVQVFKGAYDVVGHDYFTA